MTRRPRQHPLVRSLFLMLGVVALLATLASPAAAADPAKRSGGKILPHVGPTRSTAAVPAGTLGFKSYLGWVYDDKSIAVVGEVQNNTDKRQKAIGLRVTYFADENSTAPLGQTTDTVLIDGVARGGVGPFVVYNANPPTGTGAFLIELTGSTATGTAAGGGLDITMEPSYVIGETRYYPGAIENPNAFAVDEVLVALTAYDAAGKVGEVMTPDSLLGPIPAGGSAPYLIGIATDFGGDFTLARVKFLADGFRADQKSVYVTSWANYFDDIAGNTFHDDIIWLAEQDITRGCSAGKYCPTASVTRGQMASFLVRALDLPTTTTDFFTDDNGTTHESSINRVAAAGITTGCAPGKYCPDGLVSRGQMASFLARAFDLPATTTDFFTDDNGTTHEGNINRVAAADITTGCTATKYCPKADVSRGQMAAFLRRALS
jgi:hypothetical protein